MVDVYKSVDQDGVAVIEKLFVRPSSIEAAPAEAGEWMLKSSPARRSDRDVKDPVELDMGMGSRVEGFRICGHR